MRILHKKEIEITFTFLSMYTISRVFFQETKDEDLEKLVQAHCRLDLTAPMPGCATSHQRNLLFEGDLKLKEGTASKVSSILKYRVSNMEMGLLALYYLNIIDCQKRL